MDDGCRVRTLLLANWDAVSTPRNSFWTETWTPSATETWSYKSLEGPFVLQAPERIVFRLFECRTFVFMWPVFWSPNLGTKSRIQTLNSFEEKSWFTRSRKTVSTRSQHFSFCMPREPVFEFLADLGRVVNILEKDDRFEIIWKVNWPFEFSSFCGSRRARVSRTEAASMSNKTAEHLLLVCVVKGLKRFTKKLRVVKLSWIEKLLGVRVRCPFGCRWFCLPSFGSGRLSFPLSVRLVWGVGFPR